MYMFVLSGAFAVCWLVCNHGVNSKGMIGEFTSSDTCLEAPKVYFCIKAGESFWIPIGSSCVMFGHQPIDPSQKDLPTSPHKPSTAIAAAKLTENVSAFTVLPCFDKSAASFYKKVLTQVCATKIMLREKYIQSLTNHDSFKAWDELTAEALKPTVTVAL